MRKTVEIKKKLSPEYMDIQDITKSGNGAVIYVPKKFLGRKACVVIEKNE